MEYFFYKIICSPHTFPYFKSYTTLIKSLVIIIFRLYNTSKEWWNKSSVVFDRMRLITVCRSVNSQTEVQKEMNAY